MRILFSRLNLSHHSFLRDNRIIWGLGLATVLNAVLWLILALVPISFKDILVLHYNIYFNVNMIGPGSRFFIFPAIGLLLLLINNLLAFFLYQEEQILSYFLTWSATLLQFFIILIEVYLLFINIYYL